MLNILKRNKEYLPYSVLLRNEKISYYKPIVNKKRVGLVLSLFLVLPDWIAFISIRSLLKYKPLFLYGGLKC